MASLRRAAAPPGLRVYSPGRVDAGKNALLASGRRLRSSDPMSGSQNMQAQRWQSRAFFYYDNVPEIKSASQFYSQGLSALELFAAEKDAQGEIVRTENPKAIEMLDRVQDPGGGRTTLLSSYGRLMFLAGEANLFVSNNPDTEEEQWEMLSNVELQREPGGRSYRRVKAPSLGYERYRELGDDDYEPVGDKDAVAYRLWKRHPLYSEWPDSPMQGSLDVAEELLLLTQGVRARVKSRLSGPGILFLDDRITGPAPAEPVPDEDPNEDLFVSALVEAITTAIANEGSASAVAPLVVRVRVPENHKLDDLVHLLAVVDPSIYYPEIGLREEAIKRLAIGLDFPPEVLMGYADANHWSGWLISDAAWTGHLQPVADQLVGDLSAHYFRPSLREAGLPDWDKYLIAYDATRVVTNPNRGKDAMDLYDRRAIGKAALREAKGFKEDDEAPEEELREMIGVALRDVQLAMGGEPSPPQPPAFGPSPEEESEATPEGTDQEPPAPPAEVASANGHSAAAAAKILGACQLALLRGREQAGNRIRTQAKRDKELHASIEDVPAGKVASTLGRNAVLALGFPRDRDLIAGTRELVLDALRGFGVKDIQVARRIADSMEQHIARTLFEEDPRPFPASFVNFLNEAATPA